MDSQSQQRHTRLFRTDFTPTSCMTSAISIVALPVDGSLWVECRSSKARHESKQESTNSSSCTSTFMVKAGDCAFRFSPCRRFGRVDIIVPGTAAVEVRKRTWVRLLSLVREEIGSERSPKYV